MIMYGVYNSDTLTELIDTVHRMHNTTMWKERTFVGRLNQWLELLFASRKHASLCHKFTTLS